MKRHSYLFIIAFLTILVSSCTVSRKSTPVSTFNSQVNFTMDDLEYIGDVTGTSTQSYVLGIPVGGRRYTVGALNYPAGIVGIGANRGINNALYDALKSKPDADFILPVSFESTRNVAFLGSRVTITVRAKVFRIKSK